MSHGPEPVIGHGLPGREGHALNRLAAMGLERVPVERRDVHHFFGLPDLGFASALATSPFGVRMKPPAILPQRSGL